LRLAPLTDARRPLSPNSTPPTPQPAQSIWGIHSRLSSLPALESLRVCCLPGGAGLPELGRAATALTRLTSLTVASYGRALPTFPSGDLAFIGAALPRLRSLTVPRTASLEWLAQLSALTSLHFGVRDSLSPSSLAALASLPALCVLSFGSWSEGGGGGDAAPPAAVCAAVTRLVCRAVHPLAVASLQRAFPAVADAELMEAQAFQPPHFAAAVAAPAAAAAIALNPGPQWRGLQRLSVSGVAIGADLQPLAQLGALDGGLLALRLNAALSGAQLAALLAAAPQLQALFIGTLPSDIDWRHFPRHRALAVLGVGWPCASRKSLLGLGRALPGLQMLVVPGICRGVFGVGVPPGSDEPPPAAARALSSGIWRLPAAEVAPAVRLVRALRAAAAADDAEAAAMRFEVAARLHRMAEEGEIAWREMEARVEELLLPPAPPP